MYCTLRLLIFTLKQERRLYHLSCLTLYKASIAIQLEDGHEGFRGDLDGAQIPHLLFSLFLLLQQLFLSGDIAAVALGQDILSHGFYGFPGDDAPADGRLDGTSKSWRGILSFSFSHRRRARG